MKELVDLLQKRSTLIGEMETILKTAKDEKRARTEDESKDWGSKRDQVENISKEIKVLEDQDRLNRSIADKELDKEEKKAVRTYDLSKAIIGIREGGGLTGLEREMHDEGAKEIDRLGEKKGNIYIPSMLIRSLMNPSKRANEETKTTGLAGGHIPLQVGAGSVIAASPLYRELGATVYEGLGAGKLDLPFSKGHSAAAVAEAGTASQSVPTKVKGTLSAARYQGWQNYTQAYLAESALMPQMLADMMAAIDRAIGSALINDSVAVNVMTGFATSDTAAAITYAGLLAQIAEVESAGFVNEAFVLSKALFYYLAAKVKESGTAQYIIDFLGGKNTGKLGGINAHGTAFLPLHDTNKYDALYGDWKEAYVGFWGGAQLLVDPYSNSDDGYVKITFMRMGAVDSNPYAFASKRNISLA